VVEASCPECGSAIGGTNHNLNASNTRAEILDGIERRQGLGRSPWQWNRDA
jgi:RZ type zinc finger domain